MNELTEDRIFARHPRRRGAVLLVGAGAVGSLLAEQLAAMGVSPLWLIDKDLLEAENLTRSELGADELDQPKAIALAAEIRRKRPWCRAIGRHADFLRLTSEEQFHLVQQADVVVAATDEADCQLQVNAVCLAAEKPAVYPAVWVDERVRDAEVGEILWVLPGRHTPCYRCWTTFRQASADAQAARGARLDIQLVALATAQVVAALLEPADQRSAILDPDNTAIYMHGLTPTSPGIRNTFPGPGLQSRNVRIPFPTTPCPACGGWEGQAETPVDRLGATGIRRGLLPGGPFAALAFIVIAAGAALFLVIVLVIALWVRALSGTAAPDSPQVPASTQPQVQSALPDTTYSQPAVASPSVVEQTQGTSSAITMQDMTTTCQQQHGDPSAIAEVIPSPPDPPGYWIKCVNAASENLGGVSLIDYCNLIHPGTRAANPDIYAEGAWEWWRCTIP